ncbi:MAG TPA: winged helix-turn-helix domain-containing protein [Gemmatimonadaceae bacterium]|nr:winged helix-turn-helix domain-containing protein [Gemmatimonadaceae bacterium]
MPRSGLFPIEFAVTPRFDVFYALYSLTSGAPTQLDPWKVKALSRLPRGFERSAKRVAPLPIFWPLLADAIQSAPGEVTFEEALSTIREMPVKDLQRNVLAGIFHDRNTVDSLVSSEKSLSQLLSDDKLPGGELLGHFGLRPYNQGSQAVSAITMLLSKPKSFRDELALVLQKFWQSTFQRDWTALEPSLRAESFRMRDIREERSVGDFGLELNLPVAFDDEAREIRPKSGSPISYDLVDRCYVIPSAFNARRWWTKYESSSQRFTLYLPITTEPRAPNSIVEEDRNVADLPTKQRRAINAESVFRALGDTTRYAIASILARAPTTSAELARSLKVSKPTITHHVHALRSAGLIRETPSGGSTKLSLSRDTVAALSGAAVEQLFSSTGDLALGTTRKRRNS